MENGPIKLDYPVTYNGVEYKELRMRRWKVRDMRRHRAKDGDEAEAEVKTFADLCEVAPEVIDELDGKDYEKLAERFRSFSK